MLDSEGEKNIFRRGESFRFFPTLRSPSFQIVAAFKEHEFLWFSGAKAGAGEKKRRTNKASDLHVPPLQLNADPVKVM